VEEERSARETVLDLAGMASDCLPGRPVWAEQTSDLNLNLVVLGHGESIAEHRNAHVDVLLMAITGSGTVRLDGAEHALHGGQGIVIPKGAARSIASASGRFAYLTCHVRRPGLWPEPLRKD
jgi:quercetin dioxygenase-like cupin family protein